MSTLTKLLKNKEATAIIFQLIGIIVVVLNLWIVTKLAPVAQDLAVLKTRVEAVEKTNADDVSYADLERVIQPIRESLSRIEGKLDSHLAR